VPQNRQNRHPAAFLQFPRIAFHGTIIATGRRCSEITSLRLDCVGRYGGLPLLWHVLRGQMTLVGPRPESPERAAGYPASCRVMLAARPGITGRRGT